MSKTNAERQAEYRERLRERGLKRVDLHWSEHEDAAFRRAADRNHMTLVQWVVQKLRAAARGK